jgi:putative DNA primase/helicase
MKAAQIVDAEIAASGGVEARLARLMSLERPAPEDGLIISCGSDLAPKPVCWLWTHWLALGKLHILAGAPGQGKTTIALGLAATLTVGGRWPDGSRCNPGNVLIWSGEDDPEDTLLPRLLAAGGDRARSFFIKATRISGEPQPFDPARDLGLLLEAVEKLGGVSLLIVDPIVSAVVGDSHKNTEVRRALQPLVDLAAATRCAVLGISHFSKGGQGQDPTQRVVGSVAFSAVARVVLVAAKIRDEDGQDNRILARSKSNIGPDDGGFKYHLEQIEALPNIQASRVTWGAAVEGSARELLADPADDADTGPRDSAVEFLRDLLKDCPVPVNVIKTEAVAAGHSWGTVRRAAGSSLHVIKKKGGMEGGWYWSLPTAEDVHFEPKMLSKNSEHLRGDLSIFGAADDPGEDF